MKKLIFMIFVVLVLIGVAVWEQITVTNYLEDIKEKTLAIINVTAGLEDINTTEIIDMVNDLEITWKHHEEILCIIANHKDMQDLCIEIEKLRANIEVNQYEDFSAGLKVIYHLTEDYHYIMGVSWQNIF